MKQIVRIVVLFLALCQQSHAALECVDCNPKIKIWQGKEITIEQYKKNIKNLKGAEISVFNMSDDNINRLIKECNQYYKEDIGTPFPEFYRKLKKPHKLQFCMNELVSKAEYETPDWLKTSNTYKEYMKDEYMLHHGVELRDEYSDYFLIQNPQERVKFKEK